MTISKGRRRALIAVAALCLALPALALQAGATPTPLYRSSPWSSPIYENVTASAGVEANASLLDPDMLNKEHGAGFLNGGRGACILDYDGDLDDDIFVSGPRRDQLFRNDGNLSFTDVTNGSGLGDPGYGMGCAAADMDNDGDQDLIATNYKSHFALYRNNGNGTFTNMTNSSGVDDTGPQTGVAIADFDNDGLLDFFIANYLRTTDRVYRNLGNWQFEDRTVAAKISDLDHGFQPIAADYDGDGDQDVYVAVDFGPDTLWMNIGNFTFADVSRISNAFDNRGGMGAAWGDWNSDGDLDIYVTNYEEDGLWDNQPDGFRDVANATGVDDIWVGWGVVFLDFDLDGDMDIYVANGVVELGRDWAQPNKLFRNDGNGSFTDVSEGSGAEVPEITRGLAAGDLDGDGRVDLYLMNVNCPAMLLRNKISTTNGWLRVQLEGTVSNRDGVGAEVSVRVGNTYITQLMAAGSSYLSSNSKTLVFGVRDTAIVSEIIVQWPSGLRQAVYNVAANSTLRIVEADPEDPVARASDLSVDQGTPFTLDGSASSDNVAIARWNWTVDVNGTPQEAAGETAAMVIYTPGAFPGLLEVTDVFGRIDSMAFQVIVRPLARVTLDAGPDLVVAQGVSVLFVASGSSTVTPDYENDCVFWWAFTDFSGPQNLTGPRATYAFLRPGVFRVTADVRDPQGASAQDEVNVTVTDATAPDLRATVPAAVDEDRPVALDAEATTDNDPEFAATGRFAWSYESYGGPVSWTGARVVVQFDDPGVFSLTLEAMDAAGNRATQTFSLTVRDLTPPVPNAGPDLSALPGQEVVLSAAASWDNDPSFARGGRFVWVVNYLEGALNYTAAHQIVTFPHPGVFRVLLDAWDPSGNHAGGPDVLYVRVEDDVKPVPAPGGDRTVEVGARVSFDGSASTDDDPTLVNAGTFLWEFQDGADRKALRGPSAQYSFGTVGVYWVRLTVTDPSGNSASAVFKVTVVDLEAPVLVIAELPASLSAGGTLFLNGSGSTDNAGAPSISWRVVGPSDFLSQLSQASGEVVLTLPGLYTVTVTARDASGNTASRAFNVTVTPAGTTPGPSGGPGTTPGPGGGNATGGNSGTGGAPGEAGLGAAGAQLAAVAVAAAAGAAAVGWLAVRRRASKVDTGEDAEGGSLNQIPK